MQTAKRPKRRPNNTIELDTPEVSERRARILERKTGEWQGDFEHMEAVAGDLCRNALKAVRDRPGDRASHAALIQDWRELESEIYDMRLLLTEGTAVGGNYPVIAKMRERADRAREADPSLAGIEISYRMRMAKDGTLK